VALGVEPFDPVLVLSHRVFGDDLIAILPHPLTTVKFRQ
jgi:hypothetical protein